MEKNPIFRLMVVQPPHPGLYTPGGEGALARETDFINGILAYSASLIVAQSTNQPINELKNQRTKEYT